MIHTSYQHMHFIVTKVGKYTTIPCVPLVFDSQSCGATTMMKIRKSLYAVRRFSTNRSGRSTKGDAAKNYETHMQAATVRHRRNRARTKEKKLPEMKPSPERFGGRRERAVPPRISDKQTYRNKKLGVSGGLAKSARNSNRASAARRSGLSPLQPPKDISKQTAGNKIAPNLKASETTRSWPASNGSVLLGFGLTSGITLWMFGSDIEENSPFPIVQKYIKEARQLFGAAAKSNEIREENASEQVNKKGWLISSWWRS